MNNLSLPDDMYYTEMYIRCSCSLSDVCGMGSQTNLCPYYYARAMITKADIITMNYQYVLDPQISNLILPYLNNSNNIIIFDEGHNIENVVCEDHSILITASHLKQSYSILTEFLFESGFHD